jgi:hypothetical protein
VIEGNVWLYIAEIQGFEAALHVFYVNLLISFECLLATFLRLSHLAISESRSMGTKKPLLSCHVCRRIGRTSEEGT